MFHSMKSEGILSFLVFVSLLHYSVLASECPLRLRVQTFIANDLTAIHEVTPLTGDCPTEACSGFDTLITDINEDANYDADTCPDDLPQYFNGLVSPAFPNSTCTWEGMRTTCPNVEPIWISNPAVNGGWSDWTDWDSCNCNLNQQMRRRECDSPPPSNSGLNCLEQGGIPEETRTCACESDTTMATGDTSTPDNGSGGGSDGGDDGDWSDWGECDCETLMVTRTRECPSSEPSCNTEEKRACTCNDDADDSSGLAASRVLYMICTCFVVLLVKLL